MVVLPARGPLPARVEIVAAGHPGRPPEDAHVTINQVPAGAIRVGPGFDTGIVPVTGTRPNAHLRVSVRSATSPGSDPDRPLGIRIARVAVVTGGVERATVAAFFSAAHGLWNTVLIATFMLLGWSVGRRVWARDGPLPPAAVVSTAIGGVVCAAGLWTFRTEVYTSGASLTPSLAVTAMLVALLIDPALRNVVEDQLGSDADWPPLLVAVARFLVRPEVACGLATLPIAGLVWLLRLYFVDVTYWDGWEMVSLVEKSYLGTLTMSDLWMQANEHRVIVPRVLLIGLARLTNWSVIAEAVVNVSIVAAVLVAVGVAVNRWRREPQGPAPVWTLPLISLVLFSPAQWENWLWGWQFIVFLSVVASTLGLLLLAFDRGRPLFFGLALALGVISSYSFGSGVVFWVAGLVPIAFWPDGRGRWLRLALWTIVGAATIWVYTIGYLPNPHHQPLAASFTSWKDFVRLCDYVATSLGAPVAGYDANLSWWSGWFGIAFLAGAIGRRIWQRSPEPVVWFALGVGLFAFGVALLTGLGRVNFGTYAALSSRYVTMTAPFWVAVALLLADLSREARARAGGTRRPGMTLIRVASSAAAITVIGSLLVAWPRAIPSWRLWHHRLAPARASLVSNDPADDLLLRLYPDAPSCRARRAFLQAHHLNIFRP